MQDAAEYQLAPDLRICRILNGMWQVAGGHGQIDRESAISEMLRYHRDGFTTWDMADIYGPAEEFLGEFRKRLGKEAEPTSQALTKFVPNPGPMTRSIVEHYIDKSIQRMNVKSIDLLQFHWWDYNDTNYIQALQHLSKLRDEGKIKHLGVTNFDTERIEIMVEQGFKLVSSQVQYSILDHRPEVKMIPFCQKHNIKLLTYGTLLGGFLSEKYIGRPRLPVLNFCSVEYFVIGRQFAKRQQVVGNHAQAYEQRAAPGTCENRNANTQRLNQVPRDAPQVTAFVQGLID